jgi:hypothetical protein
MDIKYDYTQLEIGMKGDTAKVLSEFWFGGPVAGAVRQFRNHTETRVWNPRHKLQASTC